MLTKTKKRVIKNRKSPKRPTTVKKVDWDKYFGKVEFGTDGLTYQKLVRSND